MSSHIYHCLGFADQDINSERIYPAMNRIEIAQARELARREGLSISRWESQTATGNRILGNDNGVAQDADIPSIATVSCPICDGIGTKRLSANVVRICVICKGSGITKPGFWNKWNQWQLDSIRKGMISD